MDFMLWFEDTALSIWMRESGPAFFSSLVLHSIAMAFVVGVHVAINLRVLGFAPGVPMTLMRRFLPVAWVGLAVVTISGLLLLVAYPTKALTNAVFYFKLAAVGGALLLSVRLTRYLTGEASGAAAASLRAKVFAVLALVLWIGAITSGRFLAYTYNVLMASHLS